MDTVDTLKTNIGTDCIARTESPKYTITVKPLAKHINCETTEKILGYRYLVKMDAPVWTNSMCNGIGHLSQGWKEHVGTDTIDFILHKYKPNDRRKTYVRAVCNIRP